MRYGTNLLQQDFNAIAGPSFVTFSTSPFTVLTGGGVSPFSQPNTTDFVCGFTGTYDVFLNGYFNPSSAGIGNSVISLSAQVNGAELVRTCVVAQGHSFSGLIPSVIMTTGATLRIISQRITGTNLLSTYGPPSAPPNFLSTISISLANTVG